MSRWAVIIYHNHTAVEKELFILWYNNAITNIIITANWNYPATTTTSISTIITLGTGVLCSYWTFPSWNLNTQPYFFKLTYHPKSPNIWKKKLNSFSCVHLKKNSLHILSQALMCLVLISMLKQLNKNHKIYKKNHLRPVIVLTKM